MSVPSIPLEKLILSYNFNKPSTVVANAGFRGDFTATVTTATPSGYPIAYQVIYFKGDATKNAFINFSNLQLMHTFSIHIWFMKKGSQTRLFSKNIEPDSRQTPSAISTAALSQQIIL